MATLFARWLTCESECSGRWIYRKNINVFFIEYTIQQFFLHDNVTFYCCLNTILRIFYTQNKIDTNKESSFTTNKVKLCNGDDNVFEEERKL